MSTKPSQGDREKSGTLTFGERMQVIRDKIEQPENWEKFLVAAAPGVDVERYAQLLYRAAGANQKVLNASIDSLALTLLESVSLGLPVGSAIGYAYVVPFKGKAQFIAGYLGLLKLAYNDARATTAAAEVVRAGDTFRHDLGTRPMVRHQKTKDSRPEAPIEWAYACLHSNGPPFVAVWTIHELEAHAAKYVKRDKETGKYYSDALILRNYEMWCRKTMLRRVLKLAPMSETARTVLQREEYTEAGIEAEPEMQSGDEQPTESLRDLVAGAPELQAAE